MDKKFMEYALELAERGRGFVSPNPLVGAVIVKEGKIIGEGYHEKFGQAHAEVNAIKNAREDVKGSTIYVSLEPCSHYGKTPPCVDLIIESRIKKVIVGMVDPNPLVSGRGIDILRKNNIEVHVGLLEEDCKRLNEVFIKYIDTGKPFCLLKAAMTLDGKISTYTGDSKWISSEKSREYVHKLRHEFSGIMVGIETVIRDNPTLNTRIKGFQGKNPIRIVLDSRLRIPMDSNIVATANEISTIVATGEFSNLERIRKLEEKSIKIIRIPLKDGKIDMNILMEKLGNMGIDSILIEGGANVNYSSLEANLVDKLAFFIAPKLLGGKNAKTPVEGQGIEKISSSIKIKDMKSKYIGEDLLIEGYIDRRDK